MDMSNGEDTTVEDVSGSEELDDIITSESREAGSDHTTEYLKPGNPLEMRKAIENNCYRDGAFDRREAQGMIVYNWGASFLFNPGYVKAWEQAIGNMRHPHEEVNECEAKWHYTRGRKVYQVALAAHAGENSRSRQQLEAELFLFDTLCSRPSEIIKHGYPVTPPPSVDGYRL